MATQRQTGFEILTITQSLYDEMISKNVFGANSPVPIDRLKLLKVKHFGFDNRVHDGEIVVLDACSGQVRDIFKELYEMKFPLEKVELMTHYNGSDSLSMAHNNTSGHNLRQITGGERMSLHAYGTAIDINPVNNPFIDIPCEGGMGMFRFQPIEGMKFANRMENRLGKKNRAGMAEEVIHVFARNGFYWWGGYWNCPIDYQHFQISRSITELLVAMESDEATQFFQTVQDYYNKHERPIEDVLEERIGSDTSIVDFYKQSPAKFNRLVAQIK